MSYPNNNNRPYARNNPQGGTGRGGYSASEPEVPVPSFNFAHPDNALFAATAEKYAKDVSVSRKNKSAQLRNFYNELVMWEERCAGDVKKLNEQLPYIYMMKAKAAYAKGRDNIDNTFKALFFGIINGIKEGDIKTLLHAKLFFEAFMGYYKLYSPDKN